MIRDITLGQYYPVDSVIHRLDPRTKLFGTLIFIVSLFLADSLIGYGIATVFLFSAIHLSKVPFKFIVRGLKTIVVLLLISVSFNLFLTPGTVLFQLGFLKLTWEGLRMAGFMALRLIYLVIGSSIMTLTTTPNQLTDGLEKSLGFLNKVGVPVHESGNLIQKAKSMVPLLVPLFISAFRRATDLAMAMEARCYHGGVGRTKMKPLKYASRDRMTYVVYAAYLVLIFVFGR